MKRFERFGATTVARWMTEPLPKDVTAYMESQGRLFRLRRVRGYNGSIQPMLAVINCSGLSSPGQDKYTLNSTVFLSLGVDLAGVAMEDIVDAVAPACSDCWALQDENVRRASLDEHRAPQPVAIEQEVVDLSGWFGSRG